MKLRILHATEYEELIKIVSEAFEYPSWEQIDRDFPHLFAPDNRDHLWVAQDTSLVAHAGAWLTGLRVEGRVWPVGGIGGVCTKKEMQGKGIASDLILKACDDLKKRGAVLAFLWSGQHEFYSKLGFEKVGQQWSIVIPHDGPNVISNAFVFSSDKSEEFFKQSFELFQQHAYGVDRSRELHRLLLSSIGCQVYSAWRGDRLVAYAVVNKGRDLGDHIHEWGGESSALDILVHWLAQKIGRPQTFLSPQVTPEEAPHIYEWEKRGYKTQVGIMALAKVLNAPVLAELVNQATSSVQFTVSGDKYICKVQDIEHRLTETQFLQFAFNFGAEIEGLPLRLWWWGMESV
jgi:predicted N-acetyltransferase YhbS